jgi:adenylate cyclase
MMPMLEPTMRVARMLLVVLPPSIGFGILLNEGEPTWASVWAAVGTATIIGTPIFMFEVFYLNTPAGAGWRRLPLAGFMAARIGVWGAWIVIGSLIANATVWETPAPSPFVEPDFWWTIGFSFAIATVASISISISQLLGPGMLWNLIRGRYYRPRTEEMAVAFIDMKGSTALAERIGPEHFFEAMTRFAALVSDAIQLSGGTIYGYVGDEVIVTWSGSRTADLTPAAAALVALKRRMAAVAPEWRAQFQGAPDFRAALHVGPVVAGEIGDEKRAIALLGDTMNVGARLEQAARDLGEDLVCSPDAARRIGGFLGGELKPLAPVILKGKAAPIPVIAIRPMVGSGGTAGG